MFARSLVIVVLLAATASAEKSEKPAVPAEPPADKPKKKSPDAELLELTADPLLGKADRISGEEVRGMVAFTFDDGPNPSTTPAVIDALVKYNVPATFFIVTRKIVGKQGEAAREILKRQLESGFLVGSHSVTHSKLSGASPAKLAAEIDESVKTLAKTAERPIGMFRAPFGAIDGRGRAWLKKRGLTEAFWSIDTRDWQAKDAAHLRKKIFKMIVTQHGGVVLMHDVKAITAEIVGNVLDDLEAENCRRLDVQSDPIVPVSIHYFLRDKRKLRDIPDDVKKTTEAYRLALPARCAARPQPIIVPELLKPIVWE